SLRNNNFTGEIPANTPSFVSISGNCFSNAKAIGISNSQFCSALTTSPSTDTSTSTASSGDTGGGGFLSTVSTIISLVITVGILYCAWRCCYPFYVAFREGYREGQAQVVQNEPWPTNVNPIVPPAPAQQQGPPVYQPWSTALPPVTSEQPSQPVFFKPLPTNTVDVAAPAPKLPRKFI
ncbi:UNVERIFIED_CONTAM: hypothetical protein HDU68_003923, partial [Siphonaria sp. JEL0065]